VPQLDAVYEHGLAWARSQAFYDQYLFWQWMRMPGDVVFSAGALLMGWDFLIKLRQPRGDRDQPLPRAELAAAE
jgi:nitric oxide reductase subunit B